MYKLRTNEDLTTTQLYYDSNVRNCAGCDLQRHLSNVINPRIIVKIEERVLEKQGLYNVYFEDGTFVFSVASDRLLIDDYDALKELSKRFKP
jgi:hypothetical protein